MTALMIHHLVYSCRLAELRVENVTMEEKKPDWDLILGGSRYSSLRDLSLQGSNIPDSQRHKAVIGRPLLRIKGSVGG